VERGGIMPKIAYIKTTKTTHNTYMLWIADDETTQGKVDKFMKKLNDKNSGILLLNFTTTDDPQKLVSSEIISKDQFIKMWDKENAIIKGDADVISKMDYINSDVTIYE
jgi:hypothetical protein